MFRSMPMVLALAASALLSTDRALAQAAEAEAEAPLKKDVPYVPTPNEVVDAMLKLANVTAKDTVYDLGSGDGRIVITAAQRYGAKGVGIDIDPERIAESNQNAKKAGVTNKVKFVEQNLFDAKLSDATVVTLYLLPSVNRQLKPKLLKELRPGTRIVSHSFDMGEDWPPLKTVEVDGASVHYWVIPEKGAKAGAASTGKGAASDKSGST